jgi:ATP-dependent Clp protease adaptor protein ClpS
MHVAGLFSSSRHTIFTMSSEPVRNLFFLVMEGALPFTWPGCLRYRVEEGRPLAHPRNGKTADFGEARNRQAGGIRMTDQDKRQVRYRSGPEHNPPYRGPALAGPDPDSPGGGNGIDAPPPGGGNGEGTNTGVVVKARPKTRKPAMYKVLMLNDDYTPMEFVVHVLERFFQKNREEATRIMLHVHRRGVGVCGVFTYEVAETKVTQVMDLARQNQHPLQCTIEKE